MFPTPGQQAFDDTQRNVDAYGETDRYWRINRLEALYNGQQYEGRPSFWNKTVPVVERAPHVQSRYARAVVDRVAHFVFGRRRFPRFAAQSAAYGVTLSDEERAALGAVVTELVAATKLTSVALAYLTEGLKTGSAVVVCGMRDGLPRAQILPSKWCTPEFDARGNVRRMVVEYKALLGGDGDVVADIFRTRVLTRGKGSEVWGWGTAYGKPSSGGAAQPKAETTKS